MKHIFCALRIGKCFVRTDPPLGSGSWLSCYFSFVNCPTTCLARRYCHVKTVLYELFCLYCSTVTGLKNSIKLDVLCDFFNTGCLTSKYYFTLRVVTFLYTAEVCSIQPVQISYIFNSCDRPFKLLSRNYLFRLRLRLSKSFRLRRQLKLCGYLFSQLLNEKVDLS